MRVLVTGSNGFIGSHLVKKLIELGFDTYSLVTPFERTEKLYEDMLQGSMIISGDLRDRGSLDRAMRQSRPKVIFSLGALTSVAESFRCPYSYSETNILGLINLVESAMRNQELERFIHTASPEMLKPRKEPYKEDQYEFGTNSPYGLSKVHNYLYLKHVYEAYGFPAINVLPNNCYHRKTSMRYVTEKVVTGVMRGKLRFYGSPDDAVRNYTYIDDAVDGLIAVMERGEAGRTYHICREDYYSIGQMVEMAKEVLKANAEVEWGIGAGRPIDPQHLLLDPKLTYWALSWRPKVSLKEGIKRVADFWRDRL